MVSPRPKWWVKIADFGISKRVEEATALRTMHIGTMGYMAPEIMGILHQDDDSDDSDDGGGHPREESITYTQKVDMWALGEMVVRMVAGQPCFADVRQLNKYVVRGAAFPDKGLRERGASDACCRFVRRAMAPMAKSRMSAREAKSHEWVVSILEAGISDLALNVQADIPDEYA